jgi:hypothetical protein
MEWLKGVEQLAVLALGCAVFLAAIAVWILAWRWMWKQRGIGFAEGWFEVAERRARGEAAPPRVEWKVMRGGDATGVPPADIRPESTPAPEPTKRAPVGPPRYLVPVEKK